MNRELLIQGSIEVGLSLITGILVFFSSFKVFTVLTKSIDELSELKKNNTAVAILVASFVFGIMLLVKSAIGPAMDTLSISLSAQNTNVIIIILVVIRIFLFYILAAIFSFTILWLSIKLFMVLTTEIDEMEEINKNNTAVSIVLAVLIISLSLLLLKPLTTLLNGFVPPPSISDTLKQPLLNFSVFLQGIVQLIITMFAAIFIFFFGFKVFNLLTKDVDEMDEVKNNNIAIAILVSSFIFAMMLMVRAAIEPANDALGFAMSQSVNLNILLLTILRIILFFVLSAIFAFLMLWLAMKAFMFLTTNLDEMEEIKNKNIAVAVIIAILIISTSMLLEHGLTMFLSGLVKTPEIGRGLLDLTNLK